MNPEGIPAPSSGLRGTSYPGRRGRRSTTPTGLRLDGAKVTQPHWGWDRCALGPGGKQNNRNKVCLREQPVAWQPWAGRHNPFGIEEEGVFPSSPRFFVRAEYPKGITAK